MDKQAESLLLYLETRAVDYHGRVDFRHMNEEDVAIANRWSREGYIQFGRIRSDDVTLQGSHWVVLSERAWQDVHALRKDRAERGWVARRFLRTTDEVLAPDDDRSWRDSDVEDLFTDDEEASA